MSAEQDMLQYVVNLLLSAFIPVMPQMHKRLLELVASRHGKDICVCAAAARLDEELWMAADVPAATQVIVDGFERSTFHVLPGTPQLAIWEAGA